MQTGFATVIPYAAGTIGMICGATTPTRKNERRWNLTASCTVMALGCILAGLLRGSYWSIVGLSLITIGLYASNAHLFPLPAVFLTGPALASGIAWVNSVGILGGSVSPPIMGISARRDRELCRRPLRACRVCCAGGDCRGGRRTRDTGEVEWRNLWRQPRGSAYSPPASTSRGYVSQ